jgi:NAD(P)-dependent dehydrogenase (short-subunit alcohol dehydrogenase family)
VFEQAVAFNLFGAFRMASACKPLLAASSLAGGASVVNLASMSSYFAVPMVPGYGAAKAAVVQMTKNLAVAWAGDRIRVNAVAPGIVESNMTAPMKGIEALEKPQIDRTPLGRWGVPEDIAPAILFLACSAAGFITGQTLPVDGGYSIA